jgi:hypothetical protein
MTVTPDAIKKLICQELAQVSGALPLAAVKELLVEPGLVMSDWDYGEVDEQFACWTVLHDPSSNIGIAYCESGFGPTSCGG